MNRYAKAKARLFNKYMDPKFCVLNADDERYDYFLTESTGQVVSYGQSKDATERIKQAKATKNGMSWQLLNGDKAIELHIQQAGLFNVENASAAATAALALRIRPKHIAEGLVALTQVPGRMESVEAGQAFKVWIDFALSPFSSCQLMPFLVALACLIPSVASLL